MQTNRETGRQTNTHGKTNGRMDRHTLRQTRSHKHRQANTNKQTNKQTNKHGQTDRQTDKQTDSQTDRQTRPDQTRPDQTRPDQTRPDQTDRQTDTGKETLAGKQEQARTQVHNPLPQKLRNSCRPQPWPQSGVHKQCSLVMHENLPVPRLLACFGGMHMCLSPKVRQFRFPLK